MFYRFPRQQDLTFSPLSQQPVCAESRTPAGLLVIGSISYGDARTTED